MFDNTQQSAATESGAAVILGGTHGFDGRTLAYQPYGTVEPICDLLRQRGVPSEHVNLVRGIREDCRQRGEAVNYVFVDSAPGEGFTQLQLLVGKVSEVSPVHVLREPGLLTFAVNEIVVQALVERPSQKRYQGKV